MWSPPIKLLYPEQVSHHIMCSCLFQTPEFGTSDATAEAMHSLFEIQEELRQVSVQTHRINTKLDILRKTGGQQ